MEIRRFTTKFSKKRARERKEKIEKLEKEIEDLEENLLSINNVRYKDILEQLEIKKQQLRVFYDYINEGLKIRSRASWYECGEKNTAFFKQLMEANRKKSVIQKLNVNGKIVTEEKKLSRE